MTDSFASLPHRTTRDGVERKTGVEVEFSGLGEIRVGAIVADFLGGTATEPHFHELTVEDTELGDIRVELDISLRKKDIPLLEQGLSMAKAVVPVEIITEPLTHEEVIRLGSLLDELRLNGAKGSRAGVFLGFGVHLNPEVVAADDPHTLNTIVAFGLLEPWLRRAEDLDMTRRLMPFIETWPHGFVTQLVNGQFSTLTDLMTIASRHISSRNHGLDLMPLFAHHDRALFDRIFPAQSKLSARPTFHFRLPDCRIDEEEWSLARPWNLWARVERVADDAHMLETLRRAWLEHNHYLPGAEGRWAERVAKLFQSKDISEPEAVQ
ncbi:amidoligase family protein [Sagittula stellata]|uniref:Amidoligase enzyme n=1 Tax=Sagittula stellata (strain ATCC 700073 / DSM 11524 / E-37) TaxID=388399 RepID=A3K2K5_SAGS3|nr:amidoligase family protein [Sagittula stellata]EBA08414.1 hypothetical protein SSE37_16418 [Sagittula stellata E-37]